MLELRKRADRTGKPVGVVYRDGQGRDVDATAAKKLNRLASEEGLPEPYDKVHVWPLAGVELVGDAPADHNFADILVGRAVAEGWAEFVNPTVVTTDGYERNPVVTGDQIVLHLDTGDLTYDIVDHPGRFDGEVHHEYRCKLAKAA